ncbi:MAG: ABC transporter ATP-binding protein, partial [Microcoleus sp. C1-bin4]|nr:ABC transporter ATP-binding protein [Microcoleus sp. C1-bin4]
MTQYFSTSIEPSSQVNKQPEFLEINNLFKSYKNADCSEFSVLDNINLSIGENEYISVIGHSGCGKSTLLKIVAGLEKQSDGIVTLEGKEIRKPGADRMMVFQHYGLLPWLTVRENIRLAVDEVLQ